MFQHQGIIITRQTSCEKSGLASGGAPPLPHPSPGSGAAASVLPLYGVTVANSAPAISADSAGCYSSLYSIFSGVKLHHNVLHSFTSAVPPPGCANAPACFRERYRPSLSPKGTLSALSKAERWLFLTSWITDTQQYMHMKIPFVSAYSRSTFSLSSAVFRFSSEVAV